MIDSPPNFYLASLDSTALQTPRACWAVCRSPAITRDDYLLVMISPSLNAADYGYFGEIDHVILATRHVGATLFPIRDWPCCVAVLRIKDDSLALSEVLDKSSFQYILRGELYPTEEQARHAVRRTRAMDRFERQVQKKLDALRREAEWRDLP